MMSTYYLKAFSEQALQAALATMGYWSAPGVDINDDLAGGYVTAGPWGHLDVIGPHYSKVRDEHGNVVLIDDGQGGQMPQMELQPNAFLANLATDQPLTPEVQALQDFPKSPSRVFA